MSKKGFFISFEGGEGSGKTTQINRLAEALTSQGQKVITTREPGGTPESEKIREFIVQREGGDWSPLAECLLLFAARTMHVEKIIRPAIEGGKIVISDRFTDSTRAYQGHARGFSLDQIEELNKLVLGDFEPNLTFILDIDPEEGIVRSERRLASETLGVKQTEDKFERMDFEFHKKIRQGFLEIAEQNPKRCRLVDGSLDIDEMAEHIQEIVIESLKEE